MSNPFIPATPEQTRSMLERTGAPSVDELFTDQIPGEYLVEGGMDLPPALSEPEIQREFARLAGRSIPVSDVVSFLGGGIYDHFIPAAVGLVANRAEFVTAYTPYQPEASQGTLQAFFEYQSMMARLYGMDVSNASLYDGASALGEALFLALASKPDRRVVLIPENVHPDCRRTAVTYLRHFDAEVRTLRCREGRIDQDDLRVCLGPDTAALVIQHPNYFGCLEDVRALADCARKSGALVVAMCDPISLGVVAPPGDWGADVAVGEGQPLGLRPFMGGETLGIFTCKKEFMRRLPGRLVGAARDQHGRRGFVLTLQTREQHIRRDKATSNICTNHAHNALRATIYLSLMGPQGLARVARACVRGVERLRAQLGDLAVFSGPHFREVVVRTPRDARVAVEILSARGIFAGVALDHLGEAHENHLLVAVTEKRTDGEIDLLAAALKELA